MCFLFGIHDITLHVVVHHSTYVANGIAPLTCALLLASLQAPGMGACRAASMDAIGTSQSSLAPAHLNPDIEDAQAKRRPRLSPLPTADASGNATEGTSVETQSFLHLANQSKT